MRRRRSALLFAGAATRLLLALLCSAAHLSAAVNTSAASVGEGPVDTWAVIVDSSRYWLNYRHAANALGIYQAVRRWGWLVQGGRLNGRQTGLCMWEEHGVRSQPDVECKTQACAGGCNRIPCWPPNPPASSPHLLARLQAGPT